MHIAFLRNHGTLFLSKDEGNLLFMIFLAMFALFYILLRRFIDKMGPSYSYDGRWHRRSLG